jgi:acetyltransferase-like isoleucine patch superfamily enzyme
MGAYSYGEPIIRTFVGNNSKIYIGKYCSIASNVTIIAGGNHRTDWLSTYPFRVIFDLPGKYTDGHPASNGDIRIGNDVWLGYGCTILSGVAISDGAVIAANANVVTNIPPYAVAGGNPAKVLKYRFSEEQIDALLRIQWWNWPHEQVIANVDLLNSDNVAAFLERHRTMWDNSKSLFRKSALIGFDSDS